MSECCKVENEPGKAVDEPATCSYCGERGKPVGIVTLKSLLLPEGMKRLDPNDTYYFCRTADCPVVYFSRKDRFTKPEVAVRVFQKERDDPLPVCYCFGFTREKILEEVARTGKSTAAQEITRYVKEGRCACEMRNPQGSCCLGNVAQVVREASRV